MKYFILFVFIFLTLGLVSQKQGNNWYFGNYAGITFSTGGAPVALLNGQVSNGSVPHSEGSTAISDSSGALLFYSNGQTVWNRAHQVMTNGTGLLGNFSSTQSSIIVPAPGDSSRYFYLFTVSSGFCCFGSISDGLRYSKIDMCLDNGMGGVMPLEKNIKLVDTVAEKVAVCRHANGVDYWVVTHKFFSDKFIALKLTAAGITNTVVTALGSVHGNILAHSMGQMKISPNGQRIAIGASNGGDILDVFDFNPATGVVSNWIPILKPNNNKFSTYGVEFSADNSKLYARGLTTLGPMYSMLLQYDLSAGNINAINNSMTLLDLDMTGLLLGPGLQIGPDDKIYTPSINTPSALSVINNPNVAGVGCNYQDQTISLGPNTVIFSLPSFISDYDYSNGISSPPNAFTITTQPGDCFNPGSATVSLIGGAAPYSCTWTPSAQVGSVAVNLSGTYTVSTVNAIGCISGGTTNVAFQNNLTGTLTTTDPLCNSLTAGAAQLSLNANSTYSYTWSGSAQTGSTAPGLAAGIYTVTAADLINPLCSYSSTFQITLQNNLSGTVTTADPLCTGLTSGSAQLSLNSTGIYGYSWSGSAQTGSAVSGLAAGIYTVTAADLFNPFCSYSSTFQITLQNNLSGTLTSTDPLCNGLPTGSAQLSLNTNGIYNYSWSGGVPTGSTVSGLAAGVYTVTAFDPFNPLCVYNNTFQVVDPAAIALKATGDTVCAGQPLNLTATPVPGAFYTWSGPDNFSSSQQNPWLSPSVPSMSGVYSLTLVSANGCVVKASTSALVITSTIAVTSNTPCAFSTLTLSSDPAASYDWRGPGNFTGNAQNEVVGNVTTAAAGIYTLTANKNTICPSTGTLLVAIYDLPAGTISIPDDLCVPACLNLNFKGAGNTVPLASTFYQINNNFIGDPITRYCFSSAGQYTVTANFTDINNCVNTTSLIIQAHDTPASDFYYTPEQPLAGSDPVNFINISSGAGQDSWTWYFIDNSTEPLPSQDASYIFETEGQHAVAMIVKNRWGCSDTVVKTIVVKNEFSLYVPDAFTPNDDGLNDVFRPKGMGIKNYTLTVYDRWGEKLFETTDFLNTWDGSFKGKPCKEDVYQWKIETTGTDGKIRQVKGHLTLYR